jgi:ribosomal protein S18 acetylase RimI-like enzyme
MEIMVRPLTPGRWPDLEAIFNAKGCSVARGCWCMCYRRSGALRLADGMTRRERNYRDLKRLARADPPAGLIGYRGDVPVGWISLGPRADFRRLERSVVMKPVDAAPVWSIVCFVVPAEFRGRGVAKALLAGAIAYARKKRVKLLEAYPVDKRGRSADDAMWFGAKSMYDAAGFEVVARRRPARPVMRLTVASSSPPRRRARSS